MPQNAKYVPTHRAPGRHKAARPARAKALRATVVLTGVAAVTTGAAVSGGVLSTDPSSTADVSAGAGVGSGQGSLSAQTLARRDSGEVVSRSDRRGSTDRAKAASLSVAQGVARKREENLDDADPRDIARALLPSYGFDDSQFACLDALYVSESDWRVDADNPTSSAYGIPQALTSMHALPDDYMTSAEAQIRWGLDYIEDSYGTPCSAWAFKQGNNWY